MSRNLVTLWTFWLGWLAVAAQPVSSVRTFTIRDGLAANTISGLEQDPKGLIWISTWNGLCCYDGYQFTTFSGDVSGDDALTTHRIAMIRSDSQGNIWVRTYDSGLYLLDTRTCRYVNVGARLKAVYGTAIRPRNIYALPGGHTWITDETGQLNLRIDDRYSTEVERMEVFGQKGKPVYGRYIRRVEVDAEGREWVITDRGRMRYGSTEHYDQADDRRREVDLDSAAVRRLTAVGINTARIDKHFRDRQGNLWLASNKGLTLVTFRHRPMRVLPVADGQLTRSVLCRRDGTVLTGTQDGCIGVFSADGRHLGWLNASGQRVADAVHLTDRIYTMFEDSRGQLWIGTKGQGLFCMAQGRPTIHYLPEEGNRYALNSRDIYDIDEDAEGHLWIATYGGGVNMTTVSPQETVPSEGRRRFIHRGNDLKAYPGEGFLNVRRITHDRRGVFYASTTTGLLTFDSKAGRFYASCHVQADSTSLRTSDVMQTLVTRTGQVYVTTMGGSIQQLLSDNPLADQLHFRSVAVASVGTGNALALAEDREGRLWTVRETGVECFRQNVLAGQEHGGTVAPTTVLTEAKPAVAADGRLWIGTEGGVLTFLPSEMRKSDYRPDIVFTNVQYQGVRQSVPLLNTPELVVAPDERSLTVSFAALDYGDNYLLQYAYRMDDDTRWNYIGRTPRIAFSSLSPGRHTLVVRSTNCDGVWTDNDTVLQIVVTPTFLERLWVRLLILLMVVGLTSWAVITWLRRRQQAREREQRLENLMRQYREMMEERTPEPAATAPSHYQLQEPKIVDADEEMMDRLMKFLEQHISDDQLRIEDMADAVGMGRTVFYEKIKELVGVSPSEFLRQVRMQRALQLVTQSKMTFSQIAYAVGFTDPKYFTKCFKKVTGMTPSAYREKVQNEE